MSSTKNKVSYIITAVLLVLALTALAVIITRLLNKRVGPTPQQYTAHTVQKLMMDTLVKQTTYDTSADAQQKLEQVFEMLTQAENQLSMHIASSEISKINKGAGVSTVKVSDAVFSLLTRSKTLCQQSNGRFDITIGPLVEAWGITSDEPRVPSEDEIKSLRKQVDISKLTLNEKKKTAKLANPYMKIDLGGIAKGYACDLVREKYKELELSDGLISLGGTVYSVGTKPDGTAYTIGIRDPKGGENDAIGNLTAPDKVVSTTGGYERYFEQDGKRYHHVLDPKTGYPAETDLLSVTVISEDGVLADYLSTTLFIAGKAEVLKNLAQENFDLIAIDSENNVIVSEGIRQNFLLTNKTDYKLAE